MATQLAEAHDAGDHNDNGAIDYEAKARSMGWAPPEDFKGDPSKHIDAETFVKRGEEIMPILKARLKGLEKRLEQSDKTARQAADYFSKAEERAYQRARDDLKREMADAVDAGDTKAAGAVMDKLDALEKPGAPAKPGSDDSDQRAEDLADWMKANKWYGDNDALRIYADAQADKIIKAKGGGALDPDDLAEIANRVKGKFEDAYPDAFGTPAKPKGRSAVDGGGNLPRRGNSRTAADLPDGGVQMRRFIAAGYVKDEAAYLKSYSWDDKK